MTEKTASLHEPLARALAEAEQSATAVPPLSEQHPNLTVADAYAVQRHGRELRQAGGARIVGRKIGLTSRAMQQMLGVDEPDYGVLYDTMLVEPGGVVDPSRLIAPRVEAEIGFVLGEALHGPGTTVEDVLAATTAVMPALEIIDSRVADWRITIVDTVADNASSAMAVFGSRRSLDGLDLPGVEMTLEVGGETVTGRGDAVLGHPAAPVAWLANTLAEFGEGLSAGDLVLPGALAKALPVRDGDTARASFGTLGDVSVTFKGEG